jgi:hypothetical protein
VRKYGSGREIPRYFLRTDLGNVNFGIDTEFFKKDNEIYAKLLPYSVDFFKEIDNSFLWENVKDNHPVVKVRGLKFQDNFMLNSQE